MVQYIYKLTSGKGGRFRVRVYDNFGDCVMIGSFETSKDALEYINSDSMKYNGFPVFGR